MLIPWRRKSSARQGGLGRGVYIEGISGSRSYTDTNSRAFLSCLGRSRQSTGPRFFHLPKDRNRQSGVFEAALTGRISGREIGSEADGGSLRARRL